ncbi:uncharacterized protein LOC121424867 [Lytechinus variegatus]|uniref:uncharacterized protein LOC121424867 n=1 Tax=Lytechinus variegatus TaxID=7654 RepID=UPI001BB1114A|nr:uncharacterized protein LOC121424867 [Lytechinus variegatus]
MPNSPEDTSVSSLTRKSLPSIAVSKGRGQQTPGGLTSDLKDHQEESTSATPRKRTTPRDRTTKRSRRPDQQLYVPRRGRQTNNASPENLQSAKQDIETKKPAHQQSEKPIRVNDRYNLSEESVACRAARVESDISVSSKTQFIDDLCISPTEQENTSVNDQLVDLDIDQCVPPSSSTTKSVFTSPGAKETSVESGSECRESHCDVALSVPPCCPERGSSANKIVQESNTDGILKESLDSVACDPQQEQPRDTLCDSNCVKDIDRNFVDDQTAVGQSESELCNIVAAQDQRPLPNQRIMAEDAARLESTDVCGSGDDSSGSRTDKSAERQTMESEGGKEEVKKGDDGEEEEDSWDAMFDEEGNSLKDDEIKEITDAVGGVSVSVKEPAHDYFNFSPKDTTDYTKLEHVVEAYDFPAEFKTEDLVMSFNAFKSKGFDIKWVDDTHALIVFASAQVASDALCLQNPMLRTRPLCLASKQSKQKAKATVEFIQPYRPRPETSSLAARRMVSNALGVKSNVTKEQRAAERQKLKEAKERKRDEKKQKTDIWDGNI